MSHSRSPANILSSQEHETAGSFQNVLAQANRLA